MEFVTGLTAGFVLCLLLSVAYFHRSRSQPSSIEPELAQYDTYKKFYEQLELFIAETRANLEGEE